MSSMFAPRPGSAPPPSSLPRRVRDAIRSIPTSTHPPPDAASARASVPASTTSDSNRSSLLRHLRIPPAPFPSPPFRGSRASSSSPIGVSLHHYDLTALSTVVRSPTFPLIPPAPPAPPRHTLVLDLDETLVHVTTARTGAGLRADFAFRIGRVEYRAAKRPGVDKFLALAARDFELVAFSASSRAYVEAVVRGIDPGRRYFAEGRVLDRAHCTEHVGGFMVKDLDMLGRDLRRVVIVDNSVVSFAYHPENAILVSSWISRDADRELAAVWTMLEKAKTLDDVRRRRR